MIEDDCLNQKDDIPPRFDRQNVDRNLHAQNIGELLIEPYSVIKTSIVPLFELDDEIDFFIVSDAHGTIQMCDVDDANAADFHQMARELRTRSLEIDALAQTDTHHIIGDETV